LTFSDRSRELALEFGSFTVQSSTRGTKNLTCYHNILSTNNKLTTVVHVLKTAGQVHNLVPCFRTKADLLALPFHPH